MNIEMLETVKAEIRRLVDEAEADIKVVRLDVMVGDNNTDTYAAFRVIALEPIDAAMIEFTKRLGIDVTPELELAVKQYMREYRRLTGKVSDHEWESGPCDYAMGKALVAGIEIHVCFLYAEAEFEANENRTDGELYYTTKLSPDSWSVEKTSEKITF